MAERNGRRQRHAPQPVQAAAETIYEYVNHPDHYTPDQIECIDALRVVLNPDEFVGFLRGTIIKYQWRMGRKPGSDKLEETQKMNWYAQKLEEELMAQAQAMADEAQE
jgi:Protein of unknwon function (DUF3310)